MQQKVQQSVQQPVQPVQQQPFSFNNTPQVQPNNNNGFNNQVPQQNNNNMMFGQVPQNIQALQVPQVQPNNLMYGQPQPNNYNNGNMLGGYGQQPMNNQAGYGQHLNLYAQNNEYGQNNGLGQGYPQQQQNMNNSFGLCFGNNFQQPPAYSNPMQRNFLNPNFLDTMQQQQSWSAPTTNNQQLGSLNTGSISLSTTTTQKKKD